MGTIENSTYSSALKAIAERYGISVIYVFGSRGSKSLSGCIADILIR